MGDSTRRERSSAHGARRERVAVNGKKRRTMRGDGERVRRTAGGPAGRSETAFARMAYRSEHVTNNMSVCATGFSGSARIKYTAARLKRRKVTHTDGGAILGDQREY